MVALSSEQRAGMYGDLFELLIPGFLSAKVLIDGHVYGVRSLSTRDLYLLSAVSKEDRPEWRVWAVSSAVWMVDGICLLEDSSYSPKVAFDALMRSSRTTVSSLFSVVVNFFLRSKRAASYLESFLYEEESRRLWHATKNGDIPLSKMAGVPGVDRLGVSHLQSSWVAWNMLEDIREKQEYEWSLTKVNVSLQSNKSGQKLDARDKSRHEAEKARRLDVQLRAYRIFTGEIDAKGEPIANASGLKIHRPKTNEELVDEMRRWVSGEHDDHDRIVAEYKDRIRNQVLANEAAKAAAMEESRRKRERNQVELGATRTRLVGFTPRELAEKFPETRHQGARFIVEADPVSKTFNRYLRDEPDSGVLSVDGEKLQVQTAPTRDPVPINELLTDRKPKFDGR